MPTVFDNISVTLITELLGVQMRSTFYFKVNDLGNDPTTFAGLGDIMDTFVAAAAPICSTDWKLVCGIYENLDSAEGKVIKFDTQPGTGTGDAHPQKQVLRWNKYAPQADFLKVHRGSFSLSGAVESLSERGRTGVPAIYDDMIDFLKLMSNMPAGEWQLTPLLRWNSGTVPDPIYVFDAIVFVQMSRRFLTLNSRKTDLCAAA